MDLDLIFNKMLLIFPRILIIFNRLKFQVSPSQIASTSSLMVSGPNSPIHWIITFGGNAGVLLQAATEADSRSRVLTCTLVNLVCLTTKKAIDNAVKVYRQRLQVCVSQRRTF